MRQHDEWWYKEHEERFLKPDPRNPDYSLLEYDLYNYNGHELESLATRYRESIRKNLKTGKYEVFRHHFFKMNDDNTIMEDGWDEIIAEFETFKDALEYGERNADKAWNGGYGYGRCKRCGKPLKNPISIQRGYGAKCWSIVQGRGE